jgi:hypothetical protein
MENQIHRNIKIGITGKRNINSDILVRDEIKKMISSILNKENADSFIAFSALAKGADTIFVDVVCNDCKQPIKIILPFDSMEYEKDFIEKNDLAVYNHWISKIGIWEVLTADIPKNQEHRNDAYFSVGKYLVDTCDYMIVVWDGLKPSGKGGTAEILGYAKEQNKPVEIICVKPTRTDEIDCKIKSLLKTSDDNAVKFKNKYDSIWIVSLIFSWLTALCFDANLSFQFCTYGKIILAVAELSFIFTVYLLIRYTKAFQIHPKLLNERLRAEKLRLLSSFYHSDMLITISEITLKDDKELASIGERANEANNKSYQSKWYKYFTIRKLIEEQINYHEQLVHRRIGNIPERLENANRVIYVAWLLVLISHLVALFFQYFDWTNVPILSYYPYPDEISRFLAIGLPATYAGIEGFLYFKDWGNFKKQSISMIKFLNDEKVLLQNSELKNENMLVILNQVSSAMLADNKNWNSILSRKVAPHPIL